MERLLAAGDRLAATSSPPGADGADPLSGTEVIAWPLGEP
jgi:hypothetical protein